MPKPKRIVCSVVAVIIIAAFFYARHLSQPPVDAQPNQAKEDVARVAKLREEVKRLDETVWSKEVQAQQYEETFVKLWDNLRRSADKFAVFEQFPVDALLLGEPVQTEAHRLGITVRTLGGPGRSLNPAQRREWLAALKQQGFQIVSTEWHHKKFEAPAGAPARSTFSMTLYVTQPAQQRKILINGDVQVEWNADRNAAGTYVPRVIDATGLTIAERAGPPVFTEVSLPLPLKSPNNLYIKPVLVYDLNGDGLSEIILPWQNTVYWNRGGGKFEPEKLCAFPVVNPQNEDGTPGAAILADLNGDGVPDLVMADREINVVLFEGDKQGRFSTPGKVIFGPVKDLSAPSVITAGDVDGDDRLDLWLAQYKPPYAQGQMPTPYYDANDGYPSFLLLNQGNGKFVDATESSGLAKKRFRRTYSSSFVDLDGDGDLDLLVVSDFSGIDIYHNDGKGNFTDVTDKLVADRSNFGMGHTFGDYNQDGKLDFYVTGMSSTTARRLDAMQVGRDDFPEHQKMRGRMGYGNRMYLANADGRYVPPAFQDQVARSGWSWGCTTFDLANDGHQSIYIANGHLSGQTTKDYCSSFWTHDIYLGNSQPNAHTALLFSSIALRPIKNGMSWNGFEHNVLFLNEGEQGFLSAAFLMDIDFEYDARAVISDDLDADGRPDLLVVEKRSRLNEPVVSILHVLKNEWPGDNHWIGVRLEDEPGLSPIGAKITVNTSSGPRAAAIVNGDSYRAQHANTRHFGLGKMTRVDSIVVRWPNGKTRTLDHPAIDRYHRITSVP